MEKKNFKLPRRLKMFFNYTWIYFLIAIVIGIGGTGILNILFPPAPVNFEYTWNGVLMFMGICAGIGWVFHGTGFLLVRVK